MKNRFIKNTLILILGGFITKILGMIIKIIMTRNMSEEGISLYMLVLPSYNLFITLVTAGHQIAVSKLIAENKISKRKIVENALFISLIISFILIFIIIIIDEPIALLLHNKYLYLPILASILSLPFISISNVLKGYFFGQNKMHVQVIGNFIEQILRIIMFIFILPRINNNIYAITFIIGSNIVNEIASVIVLSLFIDNKKINIKNFKIDKNVDKEILAISIPITTSRIIGTISYFFEPILITNLLLLNGYSKEYIVLEYGIITGYTMQLLLLPSFFSMAISQSIIPLLSNAYSNKKYKYIKKKIKEIILLSFIIGFLYVFIILLKKEFFMNLIYGTSSGIKYLNLMGPIFILLYIETPLASILQSINKAKEAMKTTIRGIILKTILIVLFSYLHFGIYSFIYPMLINIIYVTISNYLIIRKEINSF